MFIIKILIVSVASILFLQTGNPANEVMVTAFLIVLLDAKLGIFCLRHKKYLKYISV